MAGSESEPLNAEHLRKLKEETDRLSLENEKARGNLMEVYRKAWPIFVAFRQRILNSQPLAEKKDELLKEFRWIVM